MGKKLFITSALILAASAGTVGVIMNSKRAKMRRFVKRTGRTMYSVGTMLQTLSGQAITE